ncbi:hypothetical protein AMATHDRAFT_81757 [Amanita thiersii Skay4041]|uniref:Uncharacterized protein n=1 Tax=Amanita thiersii Skay4041 TaxID=703135 RepID=A0A2A9NBU1_9AGAR|nr:hypothetical protein AMATHDRAFT_81757 [Amanita thiersii Skay4041]
MSQHIPSNHLPSLSHHPHITHHTTYLHYSPPNHSQSIPHTTVSQIRGIAPQDTTRQPATTTTTTTTTSQQRTANTPTLQAQQPRRQASSSSNGTIGPLIATGDWTKDLVHLAKTAELKKHALTLQLHTAHILSAHASLDQKSQEIQDIKEQKNRLDSERTRLLNSLREINEDRDKADLMEVTIKKECDELRQKIDQLTEGDYAAAKKDVDRLRQELGQSPLPSLHATLEEKKVQYLNERRLNGNENQISNIKRTGTEPSETVPPTGKRPRGRPKGSKNRAKAIATSEAPPASSS